ncbi:hypothetical protein WJX72_005032 [[Myrmecia] bisecta]|uniref:26S proteasome non-ATPase regulatory subunit 1 homolog n=1 Tax=[Myrmecia] bisecta TaxID=41462 RepID=A0AAW1R6Q5_9CHLO
MAAVAVSSASGLLSLLDEDDDSLRLHALQSLNRVVHEFWFQIASSIASVEAFYEDEEFSHRELAALVASKVFYHLGELDDALTYALGAGSLFDINEQSEYVQTILARCIDQYIELRTKGSEAENKAEIDPRLTAIVERMFDRCYRDGQFEQAVGIALESRRLDKLEQTIKASPDLVQTLTYSLNVCQQLVVNREFRQQVLRLLIRLYESSPKPDWVSISQCLMFLDDAPEVAKILNMLLKGSEEDALLAYQVCFDLCENEMQFFLAKVGEHLASIAPAMPAPAPAAPAADANGAAAAPATTEANGAAGPAAADGAADAAAATANGGASAMETDEPSTAPQPAASPEAVQYAERFAKVKRIISGEAPITLYLEFLYSHNHADLQILKNIKNAVEVRNSVCHSAVIFANAMMHSGTTVDSFLRENLEWLSRATNWAKFSATAGLGVIHRGHLAQGRALMAPYLPRNGASSSPYSEGGALYALGLIHANHGADIRDFLLESLRNTSNEVTQHGACLGLGLAALGTGDEELFEDMKSTLYLDSAVAGEAAGLALGLLCVGSATDKATELLAYAHDTQHEKIIRGLAIGLALIMYGREEGAETLIEQMTRDQDPILRYGGMYVIGLAYRGTANNAAIQKLLHFAVSDVSDDVRRAAVTNLGFVLLNAPDQCPRIVSLLSESFNPHVRYGAAMAVGVCCGGTGMPEALGLLEPLLTDTVDFVRQGALIASALVLMQQPESKVAPFRKQVDKFINDKHEEVMCRMGAIMAAGLLDSGGRNVTAGLRSGSGYFRRTSVVGLAVFTQYWYWYPLAYFVSLAFQPTALIGLNADLKMPAFQVTSDCKASLFAYPPPVSEETSTAVAKVPTAVLSVTSRAREKAKKKEEAAHKNEVQPTTSAADVKPDGAAAMDTDEAQPDKGHEDGSHKPGGDADKDKDGDADKDSDEDKAGEAKKEEAPSHELSNPARVLPKQQRFVQWPKGGRWQPLKQGAAGGIVLLKDTKPGQPVEWVSNAGPASGASAGAAAAAGAPAAAQPAAAAPDEEEPAPPAPFEYVP